MKNSTDTTSFFQYLPDKTEDSTPYMVCTAAGLDIVKPGTVYSTPPRPAAVGRILSDFQINYITHGEGVYVCGGSKYQVKPGSTLLILPGVKHSYHPRTKTGWNDYWVRFNGLYFNDLLKMGVLSPVKVFFESGLNDSVLSFFHLILDEVRNLYPLYQMRVCAAIVSLIAEVLVRERNRDVPVLFQQVVEKAKFLMEADISSTVNLAVIAKQLGVNTTHFQKYFKRSTSMTPYQYYIHKKIVKAESLLGNKGISVKETAFQLGFEDEFYFSRLFKRKTGVSPSKWKKTMGYRQVETRWFHATNFGIAPFYGEPSYGVTKGQDSQDVYYIEYAKNAIIEPPHRGSIDPVFPVYNLNARGYTRMTVDIRVDNTELLEDIDVFRIRFMSETSGADWTCTGEWNILKEKLMSNPEEFQTLECNIGGQRSAEWGDGDAAAEVVLVIFRFLTVSEDDIPGRIYFRNLRFYL